MVSNLSLSRRSVRAAQPFLGILLHKTLTQTHCLLAQRLGKADVVLGDR